MPIKNGILTTTQIGSLYGLAPGSIDCELRKAHNKMIRGLVAKGMKYKESVLAWAEFIKIDPDQLWQYLDEDLKLLLKNEVSKDQSDK